MRAHKLGRSAVAFALLIGLAACGDDDGEDATDESTTTTTTEAPEEETTTSTTEAPAEPDPERFCRDVVFIEMAAAEGNFDAVRESVDDLESIAPVELAEPVATYVELANEFLETQDQSIVEGEEFRAVQAEIHGAVFDQCGFAQGEVNTVDYAFEGFPASDALPAGFNIARVTNTGAELHEVVVFLKNDGVTQPMAEILALGEEEGQTLVQVVADTFLAPGETTYLLADLVPGNYAAVCFLPVGATDIATAQEVAETAPPHFSQGMLSEFVVG